MGWKLVASAREHRLEGPGLGSRFHVPRVVAKGLMSGNRAFCFTLGDGQASMLFRQHLVDGLSAMERRDRLLLFDQAAITTGNEYVAAAA